MIPAATESEPHVSLARDDGHATPSRRGVPSPPWSFGSFVLDPARRELLRDGDRLHVEPKVLDLLAYLVRHRERVVSRDEILDALWHAEHVSDAALGYCVKAARRAIGDSGDAQHTIETVPRRGFRFVAEVTGGAESTVASIGRRRRENPFVGRDAVLARLVDTLDASREARLRLTLVAGEPGIGKTRLADELSAIARERGVAVLNGRCHEGVGTPPFWPWTQILRALPERPIAESGPVPHDPTTAAPGTDDRFGHFDAIRGVLQHAAAAQPLLVVLDDLQWADAASLLLLRFLARELRDVALMVVAIYRDTDVRPDHPMLACAADLVRAPGGERVQLAGLSASDLECFLKDATAAATNELAERIHARTGGNPFFATEAIRLLVESGDAETGGDRVPETVRDVVARRIASLPEAAQSLLRVASVLGREFDVFAVSGMCEPAHRQRSRLLAALDELLAARLIERHGGDGAYRFAHDLVRETIYAALPGGLRASLHERAGEMLEDTCGADPGDHLAALAHHFDRASVAADPSRAIAYTVLAAERATSLLAYEEAALHYERALELETRPCSSFTRAESPQAAAELLLQLGESRARSGDLRGARDAFRRASALARARADAPLLARAALGFGGQFRGVDVLTADPELVALLEESLARLPSEPSTLRGQLMARLAIALYDEPGSLERRIELSAAAVAIAETTRDHAALAAALYTRHWAIWGPDTLDDRVAAATAMEQLARETGDRECALHAHRFLTVDALERGARAEMDRHLDACRQLAAALRQPYYRWFGAQLVAMRALLAGRVDDSERLLEEAHAIGSRAESRNVALGYHALRFWVRREQGRAGELEPLLRAFVERLPGAVSFRCALTLLYVELERPAEAHRHLEVLATDDFRALPRNAFWLASMIMLADVCAGLGDVTRARALYRELRPYAGRVGELAVGGGCLGSVDRALGRLSGLLGEHGGAKLHLTEALRIERSLDAPLLVARTQRALASLPGHAAPARTTPDR